MILEIRKKDWVSALPGIAETINTTRPSCLPSYVTPYKVWFRRKPIWLGVLTPASGIASSSTATNISMALVDLDNNANDTNILPYNDDVDPNYMLLELHRRVFLYNAKEAGKVARRGAKN